MSPPTAVRVVGAGVIGLTVAVRLAEAGVPVDVLARELPLETTSAVAGGLWLPYLAGPVESVGRWAANTFRTLTELAGDPRAGVALRPGLLLGRGPQEPDWVAATSTTTADRIGLERLTDPAPGHRTGWRAVLPLVNMDVYLPYLQGRLAAAGGTLTRLALPRLPDRGIVVNCTGVAARALAADPGVRPIRGQVVRVADPGLGEWLSDSSGRHPLYVHPHGSHVVVGGTADDGDWSPTPLPDVGREILSRAAVLVPELASAPVLGHRVGLRPFREQVRLEVVAEPGEEDGGRVLVHCYGHGGSGVTLSWGCADEVLDAVRPFLHAE